MSPLVVLIKISHDICCSNDIIGCCHDIICHSHDIICHSHDIICHGHKIIASNEFFLHVLLGAAYKSTVLTATKKFVITPSLFNSFFFFSFFFFFLFLLRGVVPGFLGRVYNSYQFANHPIMT